MHRISASGTADILDRSQSRDHIRMAPLEHTRTPAMYSSVIE